MGRTGIQRIIPASSANCDRLHTGRSGKIGTCKLPSKQNSKNAIASGRRSSFTAGTVGEMDLIFLLSPSWKAAISGFQRHLRRIFWERRRLQRWIQLQQSVHGSSFKIRLYILFHLSVLDIVWNNLSIMLIRREHHT